MLDLTTPSEGTPITEYQVESFIREAGRNIPKLVATTPRDTKYLLLTRLAPCSGTCSLFD